MHQAHIKSTIGDTMPYMKHALLGVGLLGALAAHAQSTVTLYGRLDASVNSLRFSGPNATSRSTLSSDTSYWGLRGSEDLGGGNSAYFKMESQFQVDTGAQGSATAYFNRESYVGLKSSRWGSIALGSQYAPTIWLTSRIDPFSRGYLGHIANLFQGSPRGYQPVMNNAIQYVSPTLGGFTGRAMFAPSEGGVGTAQGLGLDYAAGALNLGLGYDALRVSAASVGLPAASPAVRSRTYALGATYKFDFARLMAYYQSNDTDRLPSVDGWLLGAIIPLGGGDVRVGYSRYSPTPTSEARQLALGYTYYLSKRTTVYSTIATLKNEGSNKSLWPGRQDLAGQGLPGLGQDVRGFQVGIRHLF
jgi:GBP family porin